MKAENITNRFGLKEATIEKIIAVFSQYPNIQTHIPQLRAEKKIVHLYYFFSPQVYC